MLIGIDASKISSSRKTGVDKTEYQIILNLLKIDRQNQYRLYSNTRLKSSILECKNTEEVILPHEKYFNKIHLPKALKNDKLDQFLELSYVIPKNAPVQSFVFVHDVAFNIVPEGYSAFERIKQRIALKTSLKRAKAVFVSSNANKRDLLKYYNFREEDIRVVPLAYDKEVFANSISPKEILKTDSPYFIYVGRIEKKKNIERLLKAFKLFDEKSEIKYKLVLVGKEGFGYKKIKSLIQSEKHLRDQVIETGYVSDEDLAHLYAKSHGLVFPSLYEGFGIPVLEAMAMGIPVLTSDIPTLREVAGKAAEYVNPKNIEDIAKGIRVLSENKELRKQLIRSGFERIKQFSWQNTAQTINNFMKEYAEKF